MGGGVPHPVLDRGDTPSRPGMGYPPPEHGISPPPTWTWDGVPPVSWMGYPPGWDTLPPTWTWDGVPPSSVSWMGTPLPEPGMGYPPVSWMGIPPGPGMGYPPTNGEQTFSSINITFPRTTYAGGNKMEL